MNSHFQKILLSPLFLFSLFVLFLNDSYLKAQFHNFLTGKLSDFAGLFVFSLFLVTFFPSQKLLIYIFTGFSFVFWKSPFSQSLIDFWNSLHIFNIGRTIDYTDLFALFILPLSYKFFTTQTHKQNIFSVTLAKRILTSIVVLLSVFAFTATTLVEDRTAWIEKEYQFKLKKLEIETILRQNEKILNLKMERETDVFPANKYPDVKTDPNMFFAEFSLKYHICDSSLPKFRFIITEDIEVCNIKFGIVDFTCKEESMKPNTNSAMKEYKQELTSIFEREIIEKLRQNSSK